MKHLFVILIIIILIVLVVFWVGQDDNDTTQTDTPSNQMNYDISGPLEDVTGGNGSGTAQARLVDGTYELDVTMQNIPAPGQDFFYEGWVVRKEPFEFISTGVVEESNGNYINRFTDDRDLLAYDFYVLTLEPDDGDPAPAAHILEGTMLPTN